MGYCSLWEAGLTINPNKVQLCQQELSLLGYRLSPGVCKPDPKKLEAIRDFPSPSNIKELQRFLGMVGYYRQFIPDFAGIAKALHQLLKKDAKWEWTEEHQTASRALIARIERTAELALPNLNRPFTIQTDASATGLGAVLLQESETGLLPIAFTSRTLTQAERNYSITELECLAVVHALKKFRMYIEGTTFVVETDHQALTWLRRMKEPSGRLARWSLLLQSFDYTVRYRPGQTNQVADALSRAPITPENPMSENVVLAIKVDSVRWGLPLTRGDLIKAQARDSRLQKIIAELDRSYSEPDPGTAEIAGVILDHYVKNSDGLLLRYFPCHSEAGSEAESACWKVVVPRAHKWIFLRYFHDEPTAGHLGVSKTYKRLQLRVTWSGMKRDVVRYVRGCALCQQSKPVTRQPPGLLQPVSSQEPWELVGVDLMGPYTRSSRGNQYILVIVDHFTKWLELYPMRKISTERIWERLIEVFCRYGFPRQMLTDNASVFKGKVHRDACATFNIRAKHTSPYHPQANFTERMNRNIKQLLVTYTEEHKGWDDKLSELAFAIRTAESRSTGLTPALLTFGRELRTPLDWELLGTRHPDNGSKITYAQRLQDRLKDAIEYARENLVDAQISQKMQYDQSHRHVSYKVGDMVWRRAHPLSDAARGITASLCKRWEGPYRINHRTSSLTYRLSDPDSGADCGIAHVVQLSPFVPPMTEDNGLGEPGERKRHQRRANHTASGAE